MKTKKIFIILGIVFVVLIGIILIVQFGSLAVISPSQQMSPVADSGYLRKISESTSSVTMGASWSFSRIPRSNAGCRTSPLSLSFTIARPYNYLLSGTPADMNENELQIGTQFESSFVEISGIQAVTSPLGAQSTYLQTQVTKKEAKCNLRRSSVAWSGTVPGGMVCDFEVEVTAYGNGQLVPACYYGLSSITTKTEILKKGIECTLSQESLCSENEECIGLICQEKAIPIPTPPRPKPLLFQFFVNIWEWIKGLF